MGYRVELSHLSLLPIFPIEKFVEGVGVGVGGESFSFIPVENENAMHTHQEFQ